jgi:hypothetical protein
MAAWRAEQQLEHIAQESYPELPLVRKFYPQFFHKTDRWGRPVWIELLGSIDVDHMLQVRPADSSSSTSSGSNGSKKEAPARFVTAAMASVQ